MIIIADDLTGANDTAIQYKKQGLDTIVLCLADERTEFEKYDSYLVVACNTDTRQCGPSEAYEKVRGACDALERVRKHDTVYKKVDSYLRGNPGFEIDAVKEARHKNIAFIVPSYPENDRVVKNGTIVSSFVEVDALALLSKQMKDPVVSVPLDLIKKGSVAIEKMLEESLKEGARNFLFDSTTESDLVAVGEATGKFEDLAVFAGSAGFACYCGTDVAVTPSQKGETNMQRGVVLAVCGTRHPLSVDQMSFAAKKSGRPIVFLDVRESSDARKVFVSLCMDVEARISGGEKSVYIAVSSLFSPEIDDSAEESVRIAGLMGAAVSGIVDRFPVKALFLTGGDTALSVCRALGAEAMVPERELVAGIPACHLHDGPHKHLLVVTKSGGFGGESAIYDCVEWLGGKE
jgi:uncharacterized protein YgbK (DUF1537 family)